MEKDYIEGLGESLKLLVKTSAIVFIGVIISKILGYTYRIIIARYFGPEVYGLFSLALMVSGWFIAISALGLSEGLLRFIPFYRGRKEDEKIRYIIRFSTIVLAITSIISGLLMFLLSDFIATSIFHNANLAVFLKWFSIIIPITTLSYPFLVALRAFEKISWYSFVFNIAQNVIKVAFLGLFVFLGINSNSIIFSYMTGMFGMMVLSYTICKYKVPHIFGLGEMKNEEKSVLKSELMSYSVPILFLGVVSMILGWIDTFSIGYYKTAIEVGLYHAAIPIASLLLVAPELFMQLFFPLITREYSKGNIGLIKELSKQVSKWILLVNLPVLAGIIVFPGAAINIIFGKEYLIAENALRILSIGMLFSSVFIVSNQCVSMAGKSKLVLMNVVIASAINFVLNMILVPMQKIGFIENSTGLNGAAIATLISAIILNLLFIFQAYKHTEVMPLRRKMLNVLISAIAATALLFYLRTIFVSSDIFTLVSLAAIFGLTYLVLIFVTRALDENDWLIIRSLRNKVFKREHN